MAVHIKNPKVKTLGGPVPEHTLPYWESKGWSTASDKEVEAQRLKDKASDSDNTAPAEK